MAPTNATYELYHDPWKFYDAILKDIEEARKYIYIETYKFGSGSIGERFRNVLTKKSREGVKIKLLIDSWGTSVSSSFFTEMIKNGGEVRFFMKIKFFWDFFTKNHRRNHRKVIVIDDHITYLGSANIAGHSLNWREAMIRLDAGIAKDFRNVFLDHFALYNRYVFKKPVYTRLIKYEDFEIIRDVPSITRQNIKKRYVHLIKQAKEQVSLETPYFLPSHMLRKALMDAAKRDIDINVIIPKRSDVGLVDVIRNRYLGLLHKNKVKIWYYLPTNLHSKIMLVDNEIFCIGSANFDYRSFRYQHELMLQGKDTSIIGQFRGHISNTMLNCEPFNYEEWLKRPFIQKFIEWLFLPVRHLL